MKAKNKLNPSHNGDFQSYQTLEALCLAGFSIYFSPKWRHSCGLFIRNEGDIIFGRGMCLPHYVAKLLVI
jgi:hypothetical protein